MKDLGKLTKTAHESLGAQIAKANINYLFTLGNTAKIIGQSAHQKGFSGKTLNVPSTKEATKEIKKVLSKNSLVLIKGSRHSHLERIVQSLLGKSTQINCYHCGTLN